MVLLVLYFLITALTFKSDVQQLISLVLGYCTEYLSLNRTYAPLCS